MKVMFIADVPDNIDVENIKLSGDIYEDLPNGWEEHYFDSAFPMPVSDQLEITRKYGMWNIKVKISRDNKGEEDEDKNIQQG